MPSSRPLQCLQPHARDPSLRLAAPSHRITSAILTPPSIMHKNNSGPWWSQDIKGDHRRERSQRLPACSHHAAAATSDMRAKVPAHIEQHTNRPVHKQTYHSFYDHQPIRSRHISQQPNKKSENIILGSPNLIPSNARWTILSCNTGIALFTRSRIDWTVLLSYIQTSVQRKLDGFTYLKTQTDLAHGCGLVNFSTQLN